jgi:hypothetical protein
MKAQYGAFSYKHIGLFVVSIRTANDYFIRIILVSRQLLIGIPTLRRFAPLAPSIAHRFVDLG